MKTFKCLLFLQLILNVSARGQDRPKDTTFILREIGTYYHAIFVETNPTSKLYDELAKNIMSPWDSSFYEEGLELLKTKVNFTKHDISGMVKSWHPLHLYQGKYHVYYPSDGMYNNWVAINDSIFLQYAGGEMMTSAITDFKKTGDRQIQLSVTTITGRIGIIRIHLINEKKGIVLFEYPDNGEGIRYQLMVATAKIRTFPLIRNYCEVQKQDELEFDQPDYQKLIGKSSRN